jgi:MFS family permease
VTAAFFAMFSLFFTNAQYLQYVKGLSPFVAGVAFLPLAVCMLIVSKRNVLLTRRFGVRPVMVAGAVLIAAALVLISYADAATPYALYAVYLAAAGGGMGMSLPPLSTSIMTSLPAHRAGLGSGLNSAAREIGSAVGVAVIGTITNSCFTSLVSHRVDTAHRSPSEVLAAAARLGTAQHQETIAAFSSAAGTGYRVVALVLVVGASAAVWWHRSAERSAAPIAAQR